METMPMIDEDVERKDASTGTLSPTEAQEQYKHLQAFIKHQMREGRDFGVIPGCKKPSLWKPGAEKLLNFNGLGCRLEAGPGTILDWKEPFFNYDYRAVVFNKRTGLTVAESYGSCNSKEAKYRYVWIAENKLPRGINKDDLEQEERRNPRTGGRFQVYKLENPDIYSLVNTLQKMAQKRALIGTALIACRASDSFTMDIEEEEAPGEEHTKENTNKAAAGEPTITKKDWEAILGACKNAKVTESSLKTYLSNKFDYLTSNTGDHGGFADFMLLKVKDVEQVMAWLRG